MGAGTARSTRRVDLRAVGVAGDAAAPGGSAGCSGVLLALRFLALPLHARLLVVLATASLGEDAALLDLLVEAAQGAFERLVLTHSDFCQSRFTSSGRELCARHPRAMPCGAGASRLATCWARQSCRQAARMCMPHPGGGQTWAGAVSVPRKVRGGGTPVVRRPAVARCADRTRPAASAEGIAHSTATAAHDRARLRLMHAARAPCDRQAADHPTTGATGGRSPSGSTVARCLNSLGWRFGCRVARPVSRHVCSAQRATRRTMRDRTPAQRVRDAASSQNQYASARSEPLRTSRVVASIV